MYALGEVVLYGVCVVLHIFLSWCLRGSIFTPRALQHTSPFDFCFAVVNSLFDSRHIL